MSPVGGPTTVVDQPMTWSAEKRTPSARAKHRWSGAWPGVCSAVQPAVASPWRNGMDGTSSNERSVGRSVLAGEQPVAAGLGGLLVMRPDFGEQLVAGEIGDEIEFLAAPGDAGLGIHHHGGGRGAGEILGDAAID